MGLNVHRKQTLCGNTNLQPTDNVLEALCRLATVCVPRNHQHRKGIAADIGNNLQPSLTALSPPQSTTEIHKCPLIYVVKSTPLNKEIKHRRTTTYFVIFKANTLCTLLFSSILYTNRLLVYPSAREALAKKINISCV